MAGRLSEIFLDTLSQYVCLVLVSQATSWPQVSQLHDVLTLYVLSTPLCSIVIKIDKIIRHNVALRNSTNFTLDLTFPDSNEYKTVVFTSVQFSSGYDAVRAELSRCQWNYCALLKTQSHIPSRTSSAHKNKEFWSVRCYSLGVRQNSLMI